MKVLQLSSGLPFLISLAVFFHTCSGDTPRSPDSEGKDSPHQGATEPNLSDRELLKLVEVAAEGEGNTVALEKLQALPREDVIATLSRIRQSLKGDDPLRVKISFVFCYLNYEYPYNRSVIISAFTKTSRYKGFSADDAVVLIGTLIKRGDKELLNVVFKNVGEADTAPAEGILAIFVERIQTDPESFMLSLKEQSVQIRKDVYELLEGATIPEETLNRLRSSLLTVSSNPQTARVSKELLKHLRTRAHR